MTGSTVILLFFAVGGALVIYGTFAKNRWGINPEPVFCPRCKASLPKLRQPGSLSQAIWGGWTCPACGAGVDKWGREVTPNAPPTVIRSQREVWRIVRRRVILCAPVVFCLLMLIDWIKTAHAGIPPSWQVVLLEAGVNIVWTAVLIGASLFLLKSLGNWFKTTGGRGNPPEGGDPSDHVHPHGG